MVQVEHGKMCKYGPRPELQRRVRMTSVPVAKGDVKVNRINLASYLALTIMKADQTDERDHIKSALRTNQKIIPQKCNNWTDYCFPCDMAHDASCRRVPCVMATAEWRGPRSDCLSCSLYVIAASRGCG